MELSTLKQEIYAILKDSSCTAALDTDLILRHALDLRPEQLLDLEDLTASSQQHKIAMEMTHKRYAGMPMAYVLGYKSFWESEFYVNENVLIPRPETELMIEKALQYYAKDKPLKILDIGTGSGCIIISLLQEFNHATGIAIDNSAEALKLAEQNAINLQLNDRLILQQSNWLSAVKPQQFDLIVCNPPYIAAEEYHKYMTTDLRFEPRQALTDEADGMQCYDDILSNIHLFMQASTLLMFEHGYNQRQELTKLCLHHGLSVTETVQDLAGIDRMIIAKLWK